MRRTERRGELAVWAAMGLGVGLVAGFALAEAVGAVDQERLARAVARIGADHTPATLTPGRAVRAAALALARTPGLAGLELETRALGPGRVELLGWVPDRRSRALAERTVAAVAGITAVVNRLLVEREDSNAPLTLADQSA